MPSAIPTDTMASPVPTKDAASTSTTTTPAVPMEDESSRVFVKNLPPNITDDQLRKHFSSGGRHITDLKLIARRRIAFVGYRSADEAKAAVRYFNRSFIRMSKLSVEVAKPISDPSLPTAYKMRRLHELHAPSAAAETEGPLPPSVSAAVAAEDESASKKRKRDDLDAASNPKLREFLDVMQTQNKGFSSTADVTSSIGAGAYGIVGDGALNAEGTIPTAVFADAEVESENEEEYQSISTKKAKTTRDEEGGSVPVAGSGDAAVESGRPTRVAAITATSIEEEEEKEAKPPAPAPVPIPQQPKVDASATDDDWLRSRTNRLLDLLDPSELPAPPQATPIPTAPTQAVTTKDDVDMHDGHNGNGNNNDDTTNQREAATTAAPAVPVAVSTPALSAPTPAPSAPLSAEDQIRKTSRLFVRNLPYDATEAHIQKYFTAFGVVQEVRLYFILHFFHIRVLFFPSLRVARRCFSLLFLFSIAFCSNLLRAPFFAPTLLCLLCMQATFSK